MGFIKWFLLLLMVTFETLGRELFHLEKNVIYTGGLIRIKSFKENCWLDIRDVRYTGSYEDGRPSGTLRIVGCTPVYPEKININKANISRYEDLLNYNADGPKFEILPPDVETDSVTVGYDHNIVKDGDEFHLVVERTRSSLKLVIPGRRAPVDRGNFQVAGFNHGSKMSLPEVTFKVRLLETKNDKTWRPHQVFQLVHIMSGAILSTSGNWMPDYLNVADLKEVVGMFEENNSHAHPEENTYWTVDLIRPREDIERTDPELYETMFGDGNIENLSEMQKVHSAFSIEDMKILHEKEVGMVEELIQHLGKQSVEDILGEYEQSIDIVFRTDPNHPVDNFNLLKRTSIGWVGIKEALEDTKAKEIIESISDYFQDWEICKELAAMGILNVQRYYDQDPQAISQGKIEYEGKVFEAFSKLRAEDAALIAGTASQHHWLDSEIKWYRIFEELQDLAREAERRHDELLKNPSFVILQKYYTFKHPVGETSSKTSSSEFQTAYEYYENSFCASGEVDSALICEEYFNFDKIVDMCKNTRKLSGRTSTKQYCFNLNYQHPYLKLGPFKTEHMNAEPFIVEIHDFMYDDEIIDVQEQARGRMRTTPYYYQGKQEEMSTHRSSKIKYFSERTNEWAKNISNRLQLATETTVFTKNYRYSSENYQVMNYGLGGFISLHQDEDQNFLSPGGGRIITSMVYLSDVPAGGRTIFPKVDVTVAPKAGSLLYWSTKTTTSGVDSRMLHIGCPVIYGSKWISNKWIYHREQMNRYPCFTDLDRFLYPPPYHTMSYNNPNQCNNKILSS